MSQVKVFLLVLAFFLITNLSYGKNIDLSGLEGSVEEPELSAVLDALDKFLASKPEKNLSAQQNKKLKALKQAAKQKVTEATQELTLNLESPTPTWIENKTQALIYELREWEDNLEIDELFRTCVWDQYHFDPELDVEASDFQYSDFDSSVVWNRALWKESQETIAYVAFSFFDLQVTGQYPDDEPETTSTRACRYPVRVRLFTPTGKVATTRSRDDSLFKLMKSDF
ncbi:MAG TPA: hypothetical protein VJB34_03560 [Bdellovibrionota bacterium]|nr:hypothetical protein [Bdellovibrionota bacterium]